MSIADDLTDFLKKETSVSDVQPDKNLFECGLDSFDIIKLLTHIEEKWGVEIAEQPEEGFTITNLVKSVERGKQ